MAIGKAKRKQPRDLARPIHHTFTHFSHVSGARGQEASPSISGRLSPARYEKGPGEGRLAIVAIQEEPKTKLGTTPSFL